MADNVMLNIRIDRTLKDRGAAVLEAHGISTTEFIKQAFEYLEENQELPDFSPKPKEDPFERKRRLLREYLKTVKPDPDFDPLDYKQAKREYALKKYEALA